MTCKTSKIILFAVMIVAMIVAIITPFTMYEQASKIISTDEPMSLLATIFSPHTINNVMSETTTNKQTEIKYGVSDIKDAFLKAEPYVRLGEDYIVYFDIGSAKGHMIEYHIRIITDFIAMQNDYVQQIHDNPDEKPTLDEKLKKRFSKLNENIDKEKEMNKMNLESNWPILPAYASNSIVCGGNTDDRHDEYAKKFIPISHEMTYGYASSTVTSHGYHLVPVYASNPEVHGRDYAKETIVPEYGCGFGVFRHQITIVYTDTNKDGDKEWALQQQIKEPNPEILSYWHPVWWWTYYVIIWHIDDAENPIVDNWTPSLNH
jgi:hypothetical protein